MTNELQKRLAKYNRDLEIASILLEKKELIEALNNLNVGYEIYYHGFPELNKEKVEVCPINVKLSSSRLIFTAAGFISWDSNLHSTVQIESNNICEALHIVALSSLEDPQCVEVASDDLRYQLTVSWESLLLIYQQLRQQISLPILLIDNTLFIEDNGNYFRVIGNINLSP